MEEVGGIGAPVLWCRTRRVTRFELRNRDNSLGGWLVRKKRISEAGANETKIDGRPLMFDVAEFVLEP